MFGEGNILNWVLKMIKSFLNENWEGGVQGGGNYIIQKQTSLNAWHNQVGDGKKFSVQEFRGCLLGELEEEAAPGRTGMEERALRWCCL